MRRLVLVLILTVVLVGDAPAAAQDDVAQRNNAAVREALAQLASGNADAFLELYADQF